MAALKCLVVYFSIMAHVFPDPATKTGKKVLIIRFSSIGDIILTTPVIRSVQQQWGAEIHFITKSTFVPVIEKNPYIFRIHEYEKTNPETLREIGFDHVIDLQKNRKSAMLSARLGGKRTSFEKLNVQKWILVNAKLNFLPSKHLVDRYFDALLPLDIHNDGWGCEFYLDKEKVNAEIAGLHETSYDVIVLGAAHATKRISLEKARDILRLHRRTTLLIGGKDVVDMAALLKKEFPDVVNFTGRTNMHESAFIIRHSKMVFTGDTGMMHLAAAFQKKIVVLWGNTVPSFGMYPYYGLNNKDQSLFFENTTVGCRPCSKLGFAKCPKGHFDCMEKLVVDENAIEALDNA